MHFKLEVNGFSCQGAEIESVSYDVEISQEEWQGHITALCDGIGKILGGMYGSELKPSGAQRNLSAEPEESGANGEGARPAKAGIFERFL